MPEYYHQYCVCTDPPVSIPMRDLEGDETYRYPVYVFNVNEESIGFATTKAEYITVWNSDPDNQAIGRLSNGLGPFGFMITLNEGQESPEYVIGVSTIPRTPTDGIYEIQYEDQYQ